MALILHILTTMSMDRKIEKKTYTPARVYSMAGLLLAVGLVSWAFIKPGGGDTFRVDRDRITISTVSSGEFEDFIPIRGRVTPLKSVYLDAIEGGRVEALLVEEGNFVTAGQPLLELSNTSLQLDVMSREAEVSEQLNNLRNTRLAVEQNRLKLKSDLVDIDYNLKRLGRLVERRRSLYEQELISAQLLEDVEDEQEYNKNRREITVESQQQDELLRKAQISQLESSVSQLEKNLVIARKNLENLTITAPIDGLLSSLNAEIRRGQTVQLRLQLGTAGDALLLSRGGFFQETGGNWAFVLNPDGDYAIRRNIRLGRRNPKFFEVLDGLETGEKVIVSDYAAFGEMDRIAFKN
jgi:HlyD family secretion protein